MTINIADLRATLGLDTRPLQKGVLQAKGEVAGLKTSFSGLAGSLGALLGGAAVVAGFKKAIDATVEWGGEVKSLTRQLGVSTIQASDLAVAAHHFGLDVDQLSKGLGIFQKHLNANDAASRSLGISLRDSSGNLLPFNEVLGKVADKFKSLPDGTQKTALALNLFGRSGKTLIPLLNQGAAGLAKFHEEARKLGLELSGKQLQAITNFKFAQRDLGLALKGIEVQLGLKIIPLFTQFLHVGASFVAEINKIPGPVLAVVGGFGALVIAVKLGARLVGAVADAFKVARTAVAGLASVFGPATAAQEASNAATAASTVTTKEAAIAARLQAKAAKEATLQNVAQARAAGALGISQTELAASMSAEATAAEAAFAEQAKLAAVAAQLGISEAEAATAFAGTAAGEALAATSAKGLAVAQEEATASTLGTAGAMDVLKASLGPIAIGAGLVAAVIAKIALSGGAAKGAIEGLTSALGGTEAAFRSELITQFAKNFKTEFQDISKLAPQAQKDILNFVESGKKFSFFGKQGTQEFKNLTAAVQAAFPNAGKFAVEEKVRKISNAMNGMAGATKEARSEFEAQKTALEADTTALDNVEAGFQATIDLNNALAQLVKQGVPQQLADQFKTMGADGLVAAQQLSAGIKNGTVNLADFVQEWRDSLAAVEKPIRVFAGLTSSEFDSWAASLSANFDFVRQGLDSLSQDISPETLTAAVTQAQSALDSALQTAANVRSELSSLSSQQSSGGLTLSQLQQQKRLQQAIADDEARLAVKKQKTLADLQHERALKQALLDFEARMHAKSSVTSSDLAHETDLRSQLSKAERDAAQASRDLATAQSNLNNPSQLVLKAFEAQLKAENDYARNFQTLINKGLPEDFLKQLRDMGEKGAPLVAALAAANSKQTKKISDDFEASARFARHAFDGLRRDITRPIKIPVGIQVDVPHTKKTLADFRTEIRDQLEGGIPISASPEVTTTNMTVTAANVSVSLEGKMAGGPVFGGRSIIVGEGGPEIFTPGVNGNITPNSAIRGGDGASADIKALVSLLASRPQKNVALTVNNPQPRATEDSLFLELRKLMFLGVV